jgi:hypothetical protein
MTRFPRTPTLPLAVTLTVLLASGPETAGLAQTSKPAEQAWEPLFDGKTLTNWQSSKFSGAGAIKVENGQILIEAGRSLTGINWAGPALPATNYELALQAMRVDGNDFFAGVTFPVGDSFCSLILGGWGGSVVGLSSINDVDASENETSQAVTFDQKRWYNIRIRVTPAKIEAWLDDRELVNVELKDKRIDIRIEMDASKPLGVATWRTSSALRDIRLRKL